MFSINDEVGDLSCGFCLWQAVWRGYILRLRLEQALEYAKFEDEDNFDFQEVDLKEFNFDEVGVCVRLVQCMLQLIQKQKHTIL